MKFSLNRYLMAGALFFASSAFGTPSHWMAFKSQYPNAKAITSCTLCHQSSPASDNNLNPYGLDYQKAKYNFSAIEGLDSDGDGYTNSVEINAGTWPGDKNSHPSPAN